MVNKKCYDLLIAGPSSPLKDRGISIYYSYRPSEEPEQKEQLWILSELHVRLPEKIRNIGFMKSGYPYM